MSAELSEVPTDRKLGPRRMALLVVTAWAALSLLYTGVEDGSSDLSPLGSLVLAFYMPGLLLLEAIQGFHRNSDVPMIAGASWLFYAALGQLAVGAHLWVRTARARQTRES